MSANGLKRCGDIAPLLVFYACDEVEPQERDQIDAHLAACASCAQQLREEQEMQSALANAFQSADQLDPSGALLAQCRSELSELQAALLTNEDLSKMAVAGVNFAPSPDSSGTIQLQVRTEQPLVLSGSVDDADVRRVLTYVVMNGERFDPGVRLDCLDVLKTRTGEKDVRQSLLAAARKDQNAAVRMKALEALRDSASDNTVRDTLLEALQHDANPGVRVEAVNLLVRSLGAEAPEAPASPEIAGSQIPPDPSVDRVIHTLEGLQHRDPNRYVRLRSAAALRQIGPREVQ